MAKRIKIDITVEKLEDFLELMEGNLYRYIAHSESGKFGHPERNGIGGEFTVEDVELPPPPNLKTPQES